ncbi:hypothetical protein GPECTOR_81g218 [Gonium pectorale]|uniref:BTB domain-containing protein n=1 Tax=Gonium pectorale TaxID=33097 RepID=A0A150G1Q4_GONPE|nr:hypothetical protein GPECTOR_81g218 [Gonium pectorale]|eukprot:KXZ43768.1 hypothetical protein GPECTOR_81g218 [Gonium pectorale]
MAFTDSGQVLVIQSLTWRYGSEHGDPHGDELLSISVHNPAVPPARRNMHMCTRVCVSPFGGLILYKSTREQDLNSFWLCPGDERPPLAADRCPQPGPVGKDCIGAGFAALRSNLDLPPDVTVVAGGRAFPAHRLLLALRSQFFERLLADGLRDMSSGNGVRVELPDADPDAFERLLSYMYDGVLQPPLGLLRPLAELADRLLLAEASSHLQQQLAAATSPDRVVGDLLWAEQRGLREALELLKRRYLEWEALVLDEAPDSVHTLMSASPKLHLELYAATAKRARLQ